MICLTGGEASTEALARRLLDDGAPTLQEVRLDLLDVIEPAVFELLSAAKRGDKELVVTCRASVEGGGFSGPERERAEILRRVLKEAEPTYLDLEVSASAELRRELYAARGGTKLILSWHRFEAPGPGSLDLPAALAVEPADLLKVALQVDDAAELVELRGASMALAQRRGLEVLTVGMGGAGLISRALYRRFGSPWTYAAAPGTPATAPGQFTLERCHAWRVERHDALTPLALLGGEQVLRSPGPQVYNALFTRRGLDLIYLPVVTQRPEETLELLATLGFAGCSVTMPAKRQLAGALDRLDDAAARLGAVNTIRLEPDGTRLGSNTDIAAVRRLLEEAGVAGRDALVLGAGGAAAAAVDALQALGCSVEICGRDGGRAEALARRMGCGTAAWDARGSRSYDVLVNATPCGADGAGDPLPPKLVDDAWRGAVVLDAALNGEGEVTPLLRRARAGGARYTLGGRTWWIHQGALQMETLTGSPFEPVELRGSLRLRVPGSKSQTQRALVLAALARGESRLLGPLDCDDSRHLRRALVALGVTIDDTDPASWTVFGGVPTAPAESQRRPQLWCGEAGTTLRFLAPLSLLHQRGFVLDGSPRLRERPLDGLTGALQALGVAAQRQGTAALPLRLTRSRPTERDARVQVDASRSSQFASGLLMVAPLLPGGLRVVLTGEIVSWPYLRLTLEAMAAFGLEVDLGQRRTLTVPEAAYRAASAGFEIEGDWSSAAFMLAGGLIAGRDVEVANLRRGSVQGDRAFAGHLEALRQGVGGELVFDLTDCPDLIAPLAAACAAGPAAFGGGAIAPARICGAAHARLKESDRVAVLARGLHQAGVEVQERPDGLIITPCPRLRPAVLDPVNDHRMAMAFGLLSLREPGIRVNEPGCVSKSYPGFWQDLELLRCR